MSFVTTIRVLLCDYRDKDRQRHSHSINRRQSTFKVDNTRAQQWRELFLGFGTQIDVHAQRKSGIGAHVLADEGVKKTEFVRVS